jgi:uncharacterized OsmC-like protein
MDTMMSREVNGVDVEALSKTAQALVADPELARFRFRASNQWVEGGLNRSEVGSFHGAKVEHRQDAAPFELKNDEPPVLLSQDRAPNPVEYVVQALLGCMTTTTAYKAAAMGIQIDGIRSEVEGDLDLQGMFGLDPNVRPGFQEIRAKLFIKTRGPQDKVAALHRFSPVFDTVSRPVPVKVEVVFE